MTDLFPELRGLKGGQKQAWINRHLPVIVALNDSLGFDETAELLHMKADTLARALKVAETRPAITQSEKALSRGALNGRRIDELVQRVNRHQEALTGCFAEMRQVRDNLGQYFKLQAAASELMAEVIMSGSQTMPDVANFTEPIICKPQYKVGPSSYPRSGRHFLSCRGQREHHPRRLRPYHETLTRSHIRGGRPRDG